MAGMVSIIYSCLYAPLLSHRSYSTHSLVLRGTGGKVTVHPYAKQIRDPMYGDVGLTAEELSIIDTRQFQNLRGIKQLGLAHLVYPAATHTRFEHALGTLHMAQEIINGVNDGKPTGEDGEISDESERIVRIAALAHDIPHTSFGHSIEDDLGFRERHDHEERIVSVFGPDQEVGGVLEGNWAPGARNGNTQCWGGPSGGPREHPA